MFKETFLGSNDVTIKRIEEVALRYIMNTGGPRLRQLVDQYSYIESSLDTSARLDGEELSNLKKQIALELIETGVELPRMMVGGHDVALDHFIKMIAAKSVAGTDHANAA